MYTVKAAVLVFDKWLTWLFKEEKDVVIYSFFLLVPQCFDVNIMLTYILLPTHHSLKIDLIGESASFKKVSFLFRYMRR